MKNERMLVLFFNTSNNVNWNTPFDDKADIESDHDYLKNTCGIEASIDATFADINIEHDWLVKSEIGNTAEQVIDLINTAIDNILLEDSIGGIFHYVALLLNSYNFRNAEMFRDVIFCKKRKDIKNVNAFLSSVKFTVYCSWYPNYKNIEKNADCVDHTKTLESHSGCCDCIDRKHLETNSVEQYHTCNFKLLWKIFCNSQNRHDLKRHLDKMFMKHGRHYERLRPELHI